MFRRSLRELAALTASLAVFAGCGSSALRYSGDQRHALLDAHHLGSGDTAPAGLRRLGHVAAGCKLADARAGLDSVPLSDVGCGAPLLSTAVRQRAAAAGGTFLVDLRCEPRGSLAPGDRASCSADVWGPRDPAEFRDTPEALAQTTDPGGQGATLPPAHGSLVEAWRVLVDYWPAPGREARAPIATEQVSEIDFPRVGFVRLGDVRARGDRTCSTDTLRGALLTAAARVGATTVVDARCIVADETPLCVASVAGPEQDGPLAGVR
jgi:hypothetical protein